MCCNVDGSGAQKIWWMSYIPYYAETSYTLQCNDSGYANKCFVNRIFAFDDIAYFGWCKGVSNYAYVWKLTTDPNNDNGYYATLQAENLTDQFNYWASQGYKPRYAKQVSWAVSGGTTTSQRRGLIMWDKCGYVVLPECIVFEVYFDYTCLAGGYSRFLIGVRLKSNCMCGVVMWDCPNSYDGQSSFTNRRYDIGNNHQVYHARWIDRDNVAVIYKNDGDESSVVLAVFQYQSGGPPVLNQTRYIYNINNAIRKIWCTKTKLFVAGYNGLQGAGGVLFIWNNPMNPTGMQAVLFPSDRTIFKMKMLADNLFYFTDDYIQYSVDGFAWKRICYPYTGSSGGLYSQPKIFYDSGKVYLLGLDGVTHYADMFGSSSNNCTIANTTITHNAPLDDGIGLDEFDIGEPVYLSGNVFRFNEETRLYETTTDATDCISSVKANGGVRDYLGVCCGKYHKGDKNIGQDTIEFASHGDCYFKVDDSDNYCIGDVILIDKTILGEDVVITGMIKRMIVGKITAKINKNILAVFMD
jgi:hypothetical protein